MPVCPPNCTSHEGCGPKAANYNTVPCPPNCVSHEGVPCPPACESHEYPRQKTVPCPPACESHEYPAACPPACESHEYSRPKTANYGAKVSCPPACESHEYPRQKTVACPPACESHEASNYNRSLPCPAACESHEAARPYSADSGLGRGWGGILGGIVGGLSDTTLKKRKQLMIIQLEILTVEGQDLNLELFLVHRYASLMKQAPVRFQRNLTAPVTAAADPDHEKQSLLAHRIANHMNKALMDSQ